MSKKILNIEGIQNELEGASLYFTKQPTPPPPTSEPANLPESAYSAENSQQPEIRIRKPKVENTQDKATNIKINNDDSVEQPIDRTTGRPDDRMKYPRTRRAKVRRAFDIFDDQLISLREIALKQEKMYGERVLIGDLAQQALDMFITKEKNK